jgi:hypothetical protein
METITLEQAYYIAELTTAVAVIISLVYVGRQVKQNTDATQVNAAQVFVQMYNTFTSYLGSSEELAELWYRGTTAYQGLNNVEKIRFNAIAGQWFRIAESVYQQWKRGALDKDFFTGVITQNIQVTSMPGMHEFIKVRGHWYGPEFCKWLEAMGQEYEGPSIYKYLE